MQSKISRRAMVKGGLIAGALMPALGLIANTSAAGLPALDPKDPTAQALGFVADASKVDAAANPTFKPNQKCGTCAQFLGKAGDASGGCNIFAGKSVPAGGWCKVWAQSPALLDAALLDAALLDALLQAPATQRLSGVVTPSCPEER